MARINLSEENPKSKKIALNNATKIELRSKINSHYKICLSDALDDNDIETTCVCKFIHGSGNIEINPIQMNFMPKEIFIPKSFQLFWCEDKCFVNYELY